MPVRRRRKQSWEHQLALDYAQKREAYLASGAGRGKKVGEMGTRTRVDAAYAPVIYTGTGGVPVALKVQVTEASRDVFTFAKLNLDTPTGDTLNKPYELRQPSLIRATKYAPAASRTTEIAAGSGRKYVRRTAPDDKTSQSSFTAPICGAKAVGGKAPATQPTMKQLVDAYLDTKQAFATANPAGHSSTLTVEIVDM